LADMCASLVREADPQVVRTIAIASAWILTAALFLKMHAVGYHP